MKKAAPRSGHGTMSRANRCVGNFKSLADFNRFSYVAGNSALIAEGTI
jgi:hypothetical protein